MELLEIIKNRRSVRKFQPKEIPEKIINKLAEALIWAPSAGNLQSRKFYFVFNSEIKEKLTKAALNQRFIAQAPLVVVGCTSNEIEWKYGERGKKLYTICDVSVSIENMMLLSYELDLGTCWVGAFKVAEVKKILNIPANFTPIVILPVGYAGQKPTPPPRVSKSQAIDIIE